MRLSLARNRTAIYVTAALLAAVALFAPTPYSLILPGRAVDLRQVVSVAGRPAPPGHLYLTDVRFATRVTPAQLLRAFAPGVRVVRTGDVLPRGIDAVEYEGVEREAMNESEAIAAAVAERAAGLSVRAPRSRLMLVLFVPGAPSARTLRPLDILLALNGSPLNSVPEMQLALAHVRAGAVVRIAVLRNGHRTIVPVRTMPYHGRTILGAHVTTIVERPALPVPVDYHLPNVAGSSGGLMFALQIYRTLRPLHDSAGTRVAGTGTLDFEGRVGAIEGAQQKVAAARAAGAALFFVPAANYAEVAASRGIQVRAVATFAQTLRFLRMWYTQEQLKGVSG